MIIIVIVKYNMNYNDYVTHIAQKYRLAVSIAVIRSKPENVTLEDYVEYIRSNINDNNMDLDEFDISVNSEDFNIDETDNIINYNNDQNDLAFDFDNSKQNLTDKSNISKVIDTDMTDTLNQNSLLNNNDNINNDHNVSDANFGIYHQSCPNDVEMFDTQDLNDSITILHNFEGINNDEFNAQSKQVMNTIDRNRHAINHQHKQNVEINTQDSNDSVTILRNFEDVNVNITQTKAKSKQIHPKENIQENYNQIRNETHLKNKRSNLNILNTPGLNPVKTNSVNFDTSKINKERNKSVTEVIEILNNVEGSVKKTPTINNVQLIECDSQKIAELVKKDDKNKSICKNKAPIVQTDNQIHNKKHKSSSSNNKSSNNVKRRKHVSDKSNINGKTAISSDIKHEKTNENISYNTQQIQASGSKVNQSQCIALQHEKQKNTLREYRNTKQYKNIYKNVAHIFDTNKTTDKNTKDSTDIVDLTTGLKETNHFLETVVSTSKEKDTQETLYSSMDIPYTCNTHYSESQNDIISIDKKYIHGNNIKKLSNEDTKICEQNQPNKDNNIEIIGSSLHSDTPANLNISTEDPSKPHKKIYVDKNAVQNTEKITDTENIFLQTSNNLNYFDMSNDKSIRNDFNYGTQTKKYSNKAIPKIIYLDQDIFSQDSQIPINYNQNFPENTITFQELSPNITNYNSSDLNNEKNIERSICTQTNLNLDVQSKPISETRCMDLDIFSQESQIANYSQIPNYAQNLTQNTSILPYTKNIDENFVKQTNIEDISNPVKSTDIIFDDNSITLPVTNKIGNFTDFDPNLANTQIEVSEIANQFTSEGIYNNINVNQNCQAELQNSIQIQSGFIPGNERSKNVPMIQSCNNFDENFRVIEEELGETRKEFVSFKIIEEMNIVKTFLNKKNEKRINIEMCSIDTGYKSDSQSRNSSKLSEKSNGVLNQSAHSLFQYITKCPLGGTQDITEEISFVLGQLIDKLQEDEYYPTFLEELLDAVQNMIALVYEDSSGDNLLIQKDETIQRIILLNKSIHIQKYSIEKITNILENLHTEISTNNSKYETENIDQMENICYIFHILEMLLQKHNKITQNLSQNTQNSQEDEKFLKKTNIMDIWRKKWNPNYKENTKFESSQEKACVINACTSVLNKLIVDCIDAYSLISYYALKCFNIIQS